ncbi:PREDICTED: uncharacterized protein LOC107090775 isoform X1 [Cyprinodon variegatus]|uniref:uncharacterized protein LOC107090775 isoform X1 n=1 Tax=Cyprinodon variegatus TaxID=28743 RepID=UPI0007428CCB|nr:PREDICTED: uncharacterized protein LOC107090775 isoform X1 [Cyprinodon variegatus]
MENYTEFVQLCLSKLKKNEEEVEEHRRHSSASSLIRFYGRPILPPLLSGKQREEVRRQRDEVQKATVNKKLKDELRMAHVQTLLDSVQLKNVPTLQEFLQEAEIKDESSFSHNTGRFSVSCSDVSNATRDSLSPAPVRKLKHSIFIPPKTSTAHSAFFPSNVSPQQMNYNEYLADQLGSPPRSQPCSSNAGHQSLSSGYVTCEKKDSDTTTSGKTDFRTVKEMDNTGGFFLYSSTNTIAKMPDIINHPPIDGEELERAGLGSFLCSDATGAENVCSMSFYNGSVRCDSLRAEEPGLSHPHSRKEEIYDPFMANLDPVKINTSQRDDDALSLSDNPDLQQPLNLTDEISVQKAPSKEETVKNQIHVTDLNQSDEIRPLSLQSLLKKSQEYLRCQRMLRNQTKTSKTHQEQQRVQVEESSLSDKENEELHHKGNEIVEGKKTNVKRGAFIPSEPQKKSWEANPEAPNIAEDGKKRLSFEEEISLNNKRNRSPEVLMIPKQISVSIQQQPGSGLTFTETPCLSSFDGGVGKYRSVPAPRFCLSPVFFKSKAVDPAGWTEPKLDSSSDFSQIRVEDLKLDQRSLTAASSAVNQMDFEDATSVFTKNSLQINQLESNLCSLKVLISDLESTVKENFDNQSRHDSSTEENSVSSKDLSQIEKDGPDKSTGCLEDTQGAADGEDDEVDELKQRQSFIQFKNIDINARPEPRTYSRDDVSPRGSQKMSEILKQCKHPEGGSNSYPQQGIRRKVQLPSTSRLSVAQQMRVPSIFRNATSLNFPACDISCRGPHLQERKGNITSESEGPVPSPSLNRSYDVDTPSPLWFQEGSGSISCSQGSHSLESGREDQAGLSKVKRRLLMHVTEGSQEKNGSTDLADCSTPKAAVQRSEGIQKKQQLICKQEQLKRIHAAQVRALQEEHRKQQEELLQVLAASYRLLQDASPCSTSGSRFGDTMTFYNLSQHPSPLLQRCRPLLAATVKGFLTRRLLRTERVMQLVRTVRDMQQFLQTLQQQVTARGEHCSRQELLLQERVSLQLRAARYEVYDIFFSLSAREQMQLISWDRELAREKQLRRQKGPAGYPRGKCSLSAATQKSLERKRERMIQDKAAECHRRAVQTGQKSGSTTKKNHWTQNKDSLKQINREFPKAFTHLDLDDTFLIGPSESSSNDAHSQLNEWYTTNTLDENSKWMSLLTVPLEAQI